MDELAGLTAGAQALSDLSTSLLNSKLEYEYSKDLQSQAYDYQKDAFDRENERQNWLLRNQASLMKQGLKDAGFSTADPTGLGMSLASNNHLNTPSNPQGPNPNMRLNLMDFLSAKLLNAQTENIEAQTKKTEADTDYQTMYNDLYKTFGQYQWEAAVKNLDSDTQLKLAQAVYTDQKKLNEIKLTDAEASQIESNIGIAWSKLPSELQLMASQAFQAQQQGLLNRAEINKVWQDIRESAQRIENLKKEYDYTDAQIAVATQQVKLFQQQVKYVGAQAIGAKAEAELRQLQRDISKSMGIPFYQAKNVLDTILPIGAISAILGRSFGLGQASPVKVTGFQ